MKALHTKISAMVFMFLKLRNRLRTEEMELTVQVLRAFNGIASAVARFGMIESFGWKAEVGTAINPENARGMYGR